MSCKTMLLGALLTTLWVGSFEACSALPFAPKLIGAAASADAVVLARFGGRRAGGIQRHVGVHRNVGATRHVRAVGHVGATRHVRVSRPVVARGAVRPWVRRPYFGTVVAGVALGTIVTTSTVPAAPASNLCWYWADSSKTRGYWDYCR